MKKIVLILPLLSLLVITSFAQTSVEIMPTVGYTFADRTDFYNTYGRIDGGLSYGGSIKFNANRNFGVEFLYSHMNTQSGLYQYGFDGAKVAGGNLALDYIMVGGVQSFGVPNSTVRPFIGAFLGAAVLTPGTSGYANDTKFAVGLQLGTNIYIAPNLGVMLKAQLLSPVDAVDGGFYFSNYGSGTSISSYSDIYQFSLSAGLIIGLGRVLPEPAHRSYSRPRPRYRYYY
jgi:hypothetical protein